MRFLYLATFSLISWGCFAQTKSISEDEVVAKALENSPNLKASDFTIQQNKQLQGTAFNLTNPNITIESPTGEFMAKGILQSFDFPTVYIKRNQLLKQQTILAEKEKVVTANEVKYQTRYLYLLLQYQTEKNSYLKIQDSLYESIKKTSDRLYEAGQIDYLQKTFSESQYGEVHTLYLQSKADLNTLVKQLKTITTIQDSIIPNPLGKKKMVNVQDTVSSSPILNYYQQQQAISKKMLSLERNKLLPGFAFGYLNQGAKNTPSNLRLRYGITIPLWFWQYTNGIKAAKIGVLVSEQNTLAQNQSINLQYQQAGNDIAKYSQTLNYYEQKGNALGDELIQSSGRFYESGKYDLMTHIRTLNEAYGIKLKFIETVKNYNQSILTFNYLKGTL